MLGKAVSGKAVVAKRVPGTHDRALEGKERRSNQCRNKRVEAAWGAISMESLAALGNLQNLNIG